MKTLEDRRKVLAIRPADVAGTAQTATMPGVKLARTAWLVTVLVCLIAGLVLVVRGDVGYALVTFAVAGSAGINLV
jgi:hypothetical protein